MVCAPFIDQVLDIVLEELLKEHVEMISVVCFFTNSSGDMSIDDFMDYAVTAVIAYVPD